MRDGDGPMRVDGAVADALRVRVGVAPPPAVRSDLRRFPHLAHQVRSSTGATFVAGGVMRMPAGWVGGKR